MSVATVTAPVMPGDITEDTLVVFGDQDLTQAVVQAPAESFVLISTAIGPKGDTGPQGPPTPITALTYVFTQDTPLAVWVVDHVLPYSPNITVVDSSGRVVEGDVVYASDSEIRVTFSAPFAGVAYLS